LANREKGLGVRTGILWDRLISISDEVFKTVVRTSFSSAVREGHDACCVLLDSKGRSIVQSTQNVPSFIGTLPMTMREVLARFDLKDMEAGDVIGTNDPWFGTGHLYDLTVIRPVFFKGELLCFTGTVNHLPDVGGSGYNDTAKEMYEEGLNIPPSKLVEAGKPNSDIMSIIERNVRMNDKVLGDIQAVISANHLGERRLLELLDDEKLGREDFEELCQAIIRMTRSAMKKELVKVQGSYRSTIQAEALDSAVRIKCKVSIDSDKGVLIDYSGSSKAVDAAINVPYSYTYSWSSYAIKCVYAPLIPNNEGIFELIKVVAPDNSVVNIKPPHAVAGRHVLGHYLPSVIFRALAKASPDRVIADSGMWTVMYFDGYNNLGSRYSVQYSSSGGLGARPNEDGISCLSFPTDVSNIPVEAWEQVTDLLVEERKLRENSEGAGKYRGGFGQVVTIKNITAKQVSVSVSCNRTLFAPQGLRGGLAGTRREFFFNGRPAPGRGRYYLNPGDEVTLKDAGGGGYQNVRMRDKNLVRQDINEGLITVNRARQLYHS